jgi:hypothetical protein
MAQNRNKKRLLVGFVAVIALIGGGVAFAYWTTGGSGTGTAATSEGVENVTVVQTSEIAGMEPGDSAQTLSGTFTNPNSGPVYVGTLTASISSVDKATGAPAGTCDSSDYTLANAVVTYNAEVLADDTSTWTGPTIKFNNKPSTNQDACKGATVNLAYAVS